MGYFDRCCFQDQESTVNLSLVIANSLSSSRGFLPPSLIPHWLPTSENTYIYLIEVLNQAGSHLFRSEVLLKQSLHQHHPMHSLFFFTPKKKRIQWRTDTCCHIWVMHLYVAPVNQSEVQSVNDKYCNLHLNLYSYHPLYLDPQLNLCWYWSLVCRGQLESGLIKELSVSFRLATARWITDVINFLRHGSGFMIVGRKMEACSFIWMNYTS